MATSEAGQSPAERFFRYFQHEITALQDQMARLGDTALVGGERKDATDHCLAGITCLSSEVKDMSGVLPAYDMRTYSDAIKALQDKLTETQAQYAPKPRFAFKTKKNDSAVSLSEAAEMAAQKQRSLLAFGNNSSTSSIAGTPVRQPTPPNASNDSQSATHQTSQASTGPIGTTTSTTGDNEPSENSEQSNSTPTASTTTVSSESNKHIILPVSSTSSQTPCTISQLRECCVDLSLPALKPAPFASLTITDIQSSLLLCGSIAGPAHITGIKNSTVVISCRQFRMHECENVDIYLYCTSRPIIEDCTDLRFAEMPMFYTDLLHSATALSNGAIGTNMWESVDDFKWLKAQQSPHWSSLPESEQVSDHVWKQILPGKSDLSVEEILKAVSIKR